MPAPSGNNKKAQKRKELGIALGQAGEKAALKIYKGASHGLCTTHKDQLNEDLLAFIQS